MPAAFTFFSTDEEIASVTEKGEVTGKKEGAAEIYVECKMKDPGPNYETTYGGFLKLKVISDDPVDISGSEVELSQSVFTYNGKVQKPSIITVKGLKLREGTDYTAEWSDLSSKTVGTYTVTITGKGNYSRTTTAEYKIIPKDTKPESGDETKPESGDDNSPGIWLAMLLTALLGLSGMVSLRRRRG